MNRARTLMFSAKLAPYVAVAPFLVVFVVFRVVPRIDSGVISFQQQEGTDVVGFVGLNNHAKVFLESELSKAFNNTVFYTLGTLLVLIPVPLIVAAMLDSARRECGTGSPVDHKG